MRRLSCVDTERVGRMGSILLMHLASVEPASMQRLVDLMERDSSQMTRAIRALESKGLVTRQAGTEDRRVSYVLLTPKGHEQVRRIRSIMSAIIDEMLAPLTEKDRKKLHDLLLAI